MEPDTEKHVPNRLVKPTFAALVIGGATLVVFYTVAFLSGSDYLEKTVWDESYYHHIAVHGYTIANGDYREYCSLPFSPGYPLLARLIMSLTGLPFRPVSLVLSASLFLVTCIGIRKVFELFSSDQRRNNFALVLFCTWPGSLFFASTYAESLYAALLAWFFYHLMRKRFLLAAWIAAAALFTRSPAIILAPVLVFAVFCDAWKTNTPRAAILQTIGRCSALGPVVALGLFGYMALVSDAVGDPWAFHRAYVAWVPYVHEGWDNLFWQGLYPAIHLSSYPLITFVGLGFFMCIPLIVFPMRNRLPVELLTFAVVGWAFFFYMDRHVDPFIDVLRWSAPLFPVAYCLATWLEFLDLGVRKRLLRVESPTRQRLAKVTSATIYAIPVAASTTLYCLAINRYFHGEWVS